MNKIIAVLGVIVVITLGGLFFCVGFFTGSNIGRAPANSQQNTELQNDGLLLTNNDLDPLLETKSETLSEKIMNILASATDKAISSVEDFSSKKSREDDPVSVNALLREIASSHTVNDGCSPQTTQQQMNNPKSANLQQGMQGKKIVFVGYFKNKIALQIQQLLTGKGYKTHVEQSKTGEQNESFIFCGPFKNEDNAQKLLDWLRKHDFKESRLISVSKDAVEETLYDFINEDTSLPENQERDIPEANLNITNGAAQQVGQTTVPLARIQPAQTTQPIHTTPQPTQAAK